MQAQLQRAERLAGALAVDHDLAVEHVAAGRKGELGEVARQVVAGARLQRHGLAVDERDRAEAVVLLLVGPLRTDRQLLRATRELGLDPEFHKGHI